MTKPFKKGWAEPVQLPRGTTWHRQVAALCCKKGKSGLKILLITSRDTGRWILPKGWPMDDLSDPQAALQEAWEEAGVKKARIKRKPIGHYDYNKILAGGVPLPVRAQVYRVNVTALADKYPEVDERTRRWVTPKEAAEMVDEPDLKALLRKL